MIVISGIFVGVFGKDLSVVMSCLHHFMSLCCCDLIPCASECHTSSTCWLNTL
jgi:hypothetical protein